MQTHTETKSARVLAALASGLDARDAAKKAGVSTSYVYQVKNRKQNGHAPGVAPLPVAHEEEVIARVWLVRGGKNLGEFALPLGTLRVLLSALGDSK